jgi:hypothetical protein
LNTGNNSEFLQTIFGVDSPWVHVTDFTHDPSNIPTDEHLKAWRGDYFSKYHFTSPSNQYFTISTFYCDEHQQARRRKSLFRQTHVIVLDDVKEKLSMSEVSKLPPPTYILETSPGSEQWGYKLDTPCADRSQVENLLDGLVANGLAPGGRDPGMKGATRYVRLPEGINNKSSKLVNGQPFKCQLTTWNPENTVTMQQLAAPFLVDLSAVRREAREDGASDVTDHPLVNIPELIKIKNRRSNGRFDIKCPWVDEHTGEDDSGAAVFTNDDGTIGFKCHHGACQSRNGSNLLKWIEHRKPGFFTEFTNWKAVHGFKKINKVAATKHSWDFGSDPVEKNNFNFNFKDSPASNVTESTPMNSVDDMLRELARLRPTSSESRELAKTILNIVEELPQIERLEIHNKICDLMHWSKQDFKTIIKDLRTTWYAESNQGSKFHDDFMFVKELNQFYNHKTRIFFTPESFQNSYSHEDAEAKKTALQMGTVVKVDRLDYAPKQPRMFEEKGLVVGNTYHEGGELAGVEGDCLNWLQHWDHLGWAEHRQHMLQWMAYTILHPEHKINHMLLLGSGEGCGKDFLLYPLIAAMGENAEVISGDELVKDFNDYLLNTKYLNINETELGDRKEALAISAKLKPLAATPPETLRINQKNIKPVKIRNIVNATMTTNSQLPLRLTGISRRFYAVWSDLNTRDSEDQVLSFWQEYWDDRWEWMKGEGAKHCVHYLKTQVDLTNFNPYAAPPMTEFLREIHQSSKSLAQQTVEAFIKKKLGIFRNDLISCEDACDTLRAGPLISEDLMYCDAKTFTPIKVGLILKDISGCTRLRARCGSEDKKIWCVRNTSDYLKMKSSELYTEYELQRQESTRNDATVPLKIVK